MDIAVANKISEEDVPHRGRRVNNGENCACAMNRSLITVALLLSSIPAFAQQIDPKAHKLCRDARDYAGCVKAFTTAAPPQEDPLTPLRNAMKQVAARIRAGTSLRDSTGTFQPVVDQLAVVQASNPDAIAVQKAKLASRMFDALQLAWDTRIKAVNHSLSQYTGAIVYNCRALKATVDEYNAIPGAPFVSWDYSKGLFGWDACRIEYSQLPEAYMASKVATVLDEGAISPSEIAAREKEVKDREAKAALERTMCAMEPWNRYLEEKPAIKQWAKANPAAAEAKKKKFMADPKNQNNCRVQGGIPAYMQETWGILNGNLMQQ